MGVLPEPIEELLETALVGELTVLNERGRPVTHPLIPLYDGELIYLTSSILFSRKLEHIKRNPRVALSITDPTAVKTERFRRATIQGDATVDDYRVLQKRIGTGRNVIVANYGSGSVAVYQVDDDGRLSEPTSFI